MKVKDLILMLEKMDQNKVLVKQVDDDRYDLFDCGVEEIDMSPDQYEQGILKKSVNVVLIDYYYH